MRTKNIVILPIALLVAFSLAACVGEPEAGPTDQATELSLIHI